MNQCNVGDFSLISPGCVVADAGGAPRSCRTAFDFAVDAGERVDMGDVLVVSVTLTYPPISRARIRDRLKKD